LDVYSTGDDSKVPTTRNFTSFGRRGGEEGGEGGKGDVVGVCYGYDCKFLLFLPSSGIVLSPALGTTKQQY